MGETMTQSAAEAFSAIYSEHSWKAEGAESLSGPGSDPVRTRDLSPPLGETVASTPRSERGGSWAAATGQAAGSWTGPASTTWGLMWSRSPSNTTGLTTAVPESGSRC